MFTNRHAIPSRPPVQIDCRRCGSFDTEVEPSDDPDWHARVTCLNCLYVDMRVPRHVGGTADATK